MTATESGKIGYVCGYNAKTFWPPPSSLAILKLLREHERLTIVELERLTEASRNTLKVRLRELTQAGQIAKHGQAWATKTSQAQRTCRDEIGFFD